MANKKINQLVSKTAILSTDLFGIGDATTGQLFKKTIAELQAAIGGAVISVNGLVGTVVLDTDDIQELATPTNKYFTDARARGAISLTVTGNSGASTYSSGTGVLNVPTYTLAGLGGITASFLSGTSGISYNSTTGVISYSGTVYTDASIRALFSGSTGISYNSTTGAISYSGTVYTDSSVRALISITTTGTSGASTYNNTTGVINVPEYTLAGLGGISLTSLSGGTGITYNSSTGAISYSGTVYTDASIRALISASGAVSYNNTTGVISLTGGNLTEATSSVLTITGGSGAVIGGGTSIQVKQATTSVSGFLSSTDWTTFNNKQATITLTTTGTSGNATFSSNTLNIPNYGSALSGYLPLTGGTLTGALGGTSATFSSTVTINGATIFNGVNSLVGSSYFKSSSTLGFIVNDSTDTYNNFISYNNGNAYVRSNLGLGTTTPDAPLDVVRGSTGTVATFGIEGLTANPRLRIDVDETNNTVTLNPNYTGATSPSLVFKTQEAERMRITSTGNVGIGTSSPATYGTTNLEINGKTGGSYLVVKGNSDSIIGEFASDGAIYLSSKTAHPLIFRTSDTERMRITSAGLVGIGVNPTQSASLTFADILGQKILFNNNANNYRIDLASNVIAGGDAMIKIIAGSSVAGEFGIYNTTNLRFLVTSGGNILLGTSSDNGEKLYVSGAIRATGTITANSDITLKKNLLKIENALEKVEQINGYTYEFKEDDSKRHAGVIAQEIQTVLPEIVNKGNDGILGVEYGNISALLIEAIKEQQTQINELKALLNK